VFGEPTTTLPTPFLACDCHRDYGPRLPAERYFTARAYGAMSFDSAE